MAKVSIVMPVYNGSAYLKETLESILCQRFGDWELVCVDDGSTDDSLGILEGYAARDGRIRVFSKPNGGNCSVTTHYGVSRISADSEWYFYISQDDLMSPDLLDNALRRACETGAEVVFPDMVWYGGSSEDFRGYKGDRDAIISGREAFMASNKYDVHGFGLTSTKIVRRVGFFDETYNGGDATMKLWLLAAERVAFCEGTFYYRQDNPGAVTKRVSPMMFDVLRTNEWMLEYLRSTDRQTDRQTDRDVWLSAKRFQLDDLIGRRMMFLQNKTTLPRSVGERLRRAWLEYRRTGVVDCGRRGFLINRSYTIFKLYTWWLNKRSR